MILRQIPGERRSRVACLALVWTLALGAVAAAVAVDGGATSLRVPTTAWSVLGWTGLVVGFAIGERVQAFIEVRRQSFRLTVTEVPLVLGLVLVSPASLLILSLAARLLSWIGQSYTGFKRALNLAVGTMEVGLIELISHAIGLPSLVDGRPALPGPLGTRSVVAVLAATELTALSAFCVVFVMVTWLHGPVEKDTGNRLIIIHVTAAGLCATFALLSLQLAPHDKIGLALLIVLLLGGIGAYMQYADLVRQHRVVNQLFDFSRTLSLAPARPDALPDSLLAGVCAALECEKALLWQRVGEQLVPVVHGLTVAEAQSSTGVAQLVWTDQRPLLLRAHAVGGAARHEPTRPIPSGLRETLLVPVSGSNGIVGVLQVADRLSDATRLREDDARVLATLAAQLGTSMESSVRGEMLEHAAFHDPLTGLANRNRFGVELAAAVDASREGQPSAILLMDLDRFKEVNDSLGHLVGDQLLAAVADRITSCLPTASLPARLGGDEFAVLMPVEQGESGGDDAVQAALLLRQAIEHPIAIAGVDLVISASIGIALLPAHGLDPTVLLQRADVAMYTAKASERPVVVYESGFDDDSARSLRLASDLRTALERGQLDVYFQPKVDLARDEVLGVEALSRWSHPVHGFISPDEFIPIAERTGLVVPLTQQVLRTAVRQCANWRARGLEIGVAVNLSLRGLLDDLFVAEVATVLHEHDVPARLLTLEITESSVMRDPERTMPVLQSLRDMGVRLSVDDFGTGYSSLAHLRRLPVHEVKVDKSFVLSMSTDPANAAIVRAVVDLGSTLGLSVVAEGVEDTHSRQALMAMGCPMAQGYLFSRPLPADRLDVWLAEHRIRRVLVTGPLKQGVPNPR